MSKFHHKMLRTLLSKQDLPMATVLVGFAKTRFKQFLRKMEESENERYQKQAESFKYQPPTAKPSLCNDTAPSKPSETPQPV